MKIFNILFMSAIIISIFFLIPVPLFSDEVSSNLPATTQTTNSNISETVTEPPSMTDLENKKPGRIFGHFEISDKFSFDSAGLTLNTGELITLNNSMDFEFKNLDPGIYSIHVSGKYSFDVDINENNHQTSDFSILFIRVLPEAEIDLGAISITRKSSLIHGSKPDANEIQHYKDLGDRYRALKKSIQAANIQIYTNSKAYHGMYKNIFFSKQPSFFPLVEESAVHSLIPGFGQFYNKRQLRGKIYLSSEMTSLAGFIVFRLLENKYTDQYGKTTDMHDLILSTTYSKAVFFNAAANISLGAIYGIYLTSVLDAVIDSYWTRKKIKSSIDITQKDHSLEMGIHISSVF